MVIYKKIYFEAYTNDQYIWHTNNIAQLYPILYIEPGYVGIFPVDLGLIRTRWHQKRSSDHFLVVTIVTIQLTFLSPGMGVTPIPDDKKHFN